MIIATRRYVMTYRPQFSFYGILSTDRVVSYYPLGLRYCLSTCGFCHTIRVYIAHGVCPYILNGCLPTLRSVRSGCAHSTHLSPAQGHPLQPDNRRRRNGI